MSLSMPSQETQKKTYANCACIRKCEISAPDTGHSSTEFSAGFISTEPLQLSGAGR